jgi:hypothetical protein
MKVQVRRRGVPGVELIWFRIRIREERSNSDGEKESAGRYRSFGIAEFYSIKY